MQADQARKMKDLQRGKALLCRLVDDLSVESRVLADVVAANLSPSSDAGGRLLASGGWTASRNATPFGLSASTLALKAMCPPCWRARLR